MTAARRWLLGLLLALSALAGHIAYFYLPRARPDLPRGDSPVAALLDEVDFPAAVWVPYPHQNLAHLGAVVGAEPARLRAVARLAGLPSPALPTFGPLTLPPSSEIAIASDEAGERFKVVAQVYPAIATFAKLAGRLAGNPWLSGGEIVVEGRAAQVKWQGHLWTVASAGLAPAAAPQPVPTAGEAGTGMPGLAFIRIRQAVDPLPAGLYRLWQDERDLAITSGPTAVVAGDSGMAGRLSALEVFLLVYSGRYPALGESAQSMAFFDQADEKVMEMPRVASLREPGAQRWDLPGESLLEIAGRHPLTATASGWSITALDSTSLAGAGRVAPELDTLAGRRLRWGLWLDLRGGLAEVERIARLLDQLPFVPRRQAERWNDAHRALAPLADRYSHLTATVTTEPRVFDFRLQAVATP